MSVGWGIKMMLKIPHCLKCFLTSVCFDQAPSMYLTDILLSLLIFGFPFFFFAFYLLKRLSCLSCVSHSGICWYDPWSDTEQGPPGPPGCAPGVSQVGASWKHTNRTARGAGVWSREHLGGFWARAALVERPGAEAQFRCLPGGCWLELHYQLK